MDQLTITFITATTALVAGVLGPLVSYGVSRHQLHATLVSNNRERWIEALRDSIAEYMALVTSIALLEKNAPNDLGEAVLANAELRAKGERMLLVRGRILLMTNPGESFQKTLRDCIDGAHATLLTRERLSVAQWQSHLERIAEAGHAALKAEWSRVKRGE